MGAMSLNGCPTQISLFVCIVYSKHGVCGLDRPSSQGVQFVRRKSLGEQRLWFRFARAGASSDFHKSPGIEVAESNKQNGKQISIPPKPKKTNTNMSNASKSLKSTRDKTRKTTGVKLVQPPGLENDAAFTEEPMLDFNSAAEMPIIGNEETPSQNTEETSNSPLEGAWNSEVVQRWMASLSGTPTVGEFQQLFHQLEKCENPSTVLHLIDWVKQQSQWTLDHAVYSMVLSLLGKMQCVDNAQQIFDDMTKESMFPGTCDYNALIAGYVKCGNLKQAVAVFEKMVELRVPRSLSTYGILIEGCLTGLDGWEAVRWIYGEMQQDGIVPDKTTQTNLISLYRRKGWHREILDLFEDMQRWGCKPDKIQYRSIIESYKVLGDVNGLLKVHEMIIANRAIKHDRGLSNTIISVLCYAGQTKNALQCYIQMREAGISLNSKIHLMLINAFIKAEDWAALDYICNEINAGSLQLDLIVYNQLIAAYGKAGRLDAVRSIVKLLRKSKHDLDLVTNNTLLDVYGKEGWIDKMVELFSEMTRTCVKPDAKAINTFLTTFGKAGRVDKVLDVINFSRSCGRRPYLFQYKNLLRVLIKKGRFEDVWKIVEDMKKERYLPVLDTYNSLLPLFGRNSIRDALKLLHDMIDTNILPDSSTFRQMIEIFSQKGMVDECSKIFEVAQKFLGEEQDKFLEPMLAACCRLRLMEKADQILKKLELRNDPPHQIWYHWVISGYGRVGLWRSSELVFERMKENGIDPNAYSYAFLLEAYTICNQWEKGQNLIQQIQATDISSGIIRFHNAVISYYIHFGNREAAHHVYNDIQGKDAKLNSKTYAIMVDAFMENGYLDKNILNFIQGLKGVDLSSRFLVDGALLQAISKCKRKEDALVIVQALHEIGCPKVICNLLENSSLIGNEVSDHLWESVTAHFSLRDTTDWESLRGYHNSLIDALWCFRLEKRAIEVLRISASIGIFGQMCQWTSHTWILDIHFASIGAAQILLLSWFALIQNIVLNGKDIPPKISIFLSTDWQLRTCKRDIIQMAIEAHLNDMKVPFVVKDDCSEIELIMPSFLQWIRKDDASKYLLLFNVL